MAFARPGVYLTETLAEPIPVSEINAAAFGALVGPLDRGPTSPTFLASWADFVRRFGGFSGDAALPHGVYSAFQNGSRGMYVARLAGAGASRAARILLVDAVNGLSVRAENPGTWGNSLLLDVIASGRPGYFTLAIRTVEQGTLEQYTDVSLNPADARYVVTVVNQTSSLVRLEDVRADTSDVTDTLTPQVGTSLTGGANGGAVSAEEHADLREAFDQIDTPLILNLPGETDTTVLAAWSGWGEDRMNVFHVIDPAIGLSATQALSAAAALPATSYAATYFPNIVISDPSSRVPGATRIIPPGGAMVGVMQATDATIGPWKAPAGLTSSIRGAVALERRLTNSELDALNTAVTPVNAIRQVPGSGVVPYGTRTLLAGRADKYIPVRRTLIYVRDALMDITRFAVFEPNDARLWSDIKTRCNAFLQDVYQQGGLRGASPSQAYFTRCDGTLNGLAQIQNGEVRVEVGLALQYPAEFIVISLGQFEGGATATESA